MCAIYVAGWETNYAVVRGGGGFVLKIFAVVQIIFYAVDAAWGIYGNLDWNFAASSNAAAI